MRRLRASSLASSAPTTRLRPQWTKDTRMLTSVTTYTACLLVLGMEASLLMPRLTSGALATQEPVTTIRAICMLKASSSQKPLYQCWTIWKGPCLATKTPSRNATKVSTTAKMLASGIYFRDQRSSELPMRLIGFPDRFNVVGFCAILILLSLRSHVCLWGAARRPFFPGRARLPALGAAVSLSSFHAAFSKTLFTKRVLP